MFNLDQQLAINWTSELINIYGKKGVSNIQDGYCEDLDIDSLIKSLFKIMKNFTNSK